MPILRLLSEAAGEVEHPNNYEHGGVEDCRGEQKPKKKASGQQTQVEVEIAPDKGRVFFPTKEKNSDQVKRVGPHEVEIGGGGGMLGEIAKEDEQATDAAGDQKEGDSYSF